MLLSKIVEVTCSSSNMKYYKSKGYNVKYREKIEVKIEDLKLGSNIKVKVECDKCHKIKMLSYFKYNKNISKYNIYTCSSKCAQIKNIKTNNIKYGVNNPLQNKEIYKKMEETNLIRYGKKNVFENEEIKKKIVKTTFENYGVEHYLQSNENLEQMCENNVKKFGYKYVTQVPKFKEKIKKTNNEKYGTNCPMQNKKIRKKADKTVKEKYGVDNISQLPEIKKENAKKLFLVNQQMYKDKYNLNVISYDIKKHTYIIHCDECENDYKIHTSLLSNRLFKNKTVCTKCNPYSTFNSDFEGKLTKFIKENYNGKIKKDRTILSGQELDVYLPDLNLAFEFNGLYWHSDINKENNYHKNKTDLCEQHNVRLIHIFEDEWNNKTDIVKSFILSLLGKYKTEINGYLCDIKLVDDNSAELFIKNNYIKKYIKSDINIGLYENNILVSLMSFKKLKDKYELTMFCNKNNYNVINSEKVLFNYFTNNYKFNSIVTYVDRCYYNGDIYNKLGFNIVEITKPNFYYVMFDNKHNDKYTKKELIKEGFDVNDEKISKIYDSGLIKYIYK